MSIHIVQKEIELFLADQQAGVLVVTGKWGVGKTFAWAHFLKDAKTKGKLAFGHYAYVSLFGLGNLEDLRSAVFQNTTKREDIGKFADLETLESVVESAPSLWRKSGKITRLIPGVDKYTAAFEKIGFFWVKHQLICIDDLERKSASLDIRDVLGMISHLKEQRECKIVLLLNDEQFQEADGTEFRNQLEKVADITLRFEPTPAEAAAIGINPNAPFREKLRTHCEALGIVNIRTIKKIERVAFRLQTELANFDSRVFEQALHSLALLSFAKLQPEEAPSLDYIRNLGSTDDMLDMLDGAPQPSPREAQWQALLSSYSFGQVDEFDAVVLKTVLDGHLDTEALNDAAKVLQSHLLASDENQAFQQAWEMYHGSFDENAGEVTEALANAIRNVPRAISPMNLSSTIAMLKELNWPGNTADLIVGYVAARDEPKSFWDLARDTFGGDVRDSDVRAAFSAKLATFHDQRNPVETLIDIGRSRGWNREDLLFLSALSPDDFYEILKPLRGTKLRQAIAGALSFRDIANADEQIESITRNATSALQRIGRESNINRRRVTQRGVIIDDDEAHDEIA